VARLGKFSAPMPRRLHTYYMGRGPPKILIGSTPISRFADFKL
jgi:hypothetical protein